MNPPAEDNPSDRHPSGDSSSPSRHEPAVVEPTFVDNDADIAPTDRSNRRKWLIVGGVIVVVVGLVVGVGIWHFMSPRTAGSPSEAMEIYLEAIKDRDTEQAGKVLCAAITRGKGVKVSDEYNVTKLDYSVGTPQKISTTQFHVPVTVEAEFSSDGGKTTRRDTPTYQVIKEDDEWKVCGFAAAKSTSESGADGADSR